MIGISSFVPLTRSVVTALAKPKADTAPEASEAPKPAGRQAVGPLPDFEDRSRPAMSRPAGDGSRPMSLTPFKYAYILKLLDDYIEAQEKIRKAIIKEPDKKDLLDRLEAAIKKLKERITSLSKGGQAVDLTELRDCIAELEGLEAELQEAGLGKSLAADKLTELINMLLCIEYIMNLRDKGFENAIAIYNRARERIDQNGGKLTKDDIRYIFGLNGPNESLTAEAYDMLFDGGEISSMTQFARVCRTIARNVESFSISFVQYCKAEDFTLLEDVGSPILMAYKYLLLKMGIETKLTSRINLEYILKELQAKQTILVSLHGKEDEHLKSLISIFSSALGRVRGECSEEEQARQIKEELAVATLGEMRRYINTKYSENGPDADPRAPEIMFEKLAELSKPNPDKFAKVVFDYLSNGSFNTDDLKGEGLSIKDVRIAALKEAAPGRPARNNPDTGPRPEYN